MEINRMQNFLALDTSTDTGLVVLKFNDRLYTRTQEEPREHNRFLLTMVQEVLAEAGISLADIDAFVCGVGPGSFVGVRLGVAVVQGLAYAMQKPVYKVSSLALQAQAFFRQYPQQKEVVIVQDARMQAVYFGRYRNSISVAKLIGYEQLFPLNNQTLKQFKKEDTLAGNGAIFFKDVASIMMAATPLLIAEDLATQAMNSIEHTPKLSAQALQPVYFDDEGNWRKVNVN
jgi:tRNA threonylcarbamoyladenosine biosynthesis protein TsaB